MNFLIRFYSILFFDPHGWSKKENSPNFNFINKKAMPTKIGVYGFDIDLYLYVFFELIPFNPMSPMHMS